MKHNGLDGFESDNGTGKLQIRRIEEKARKGKEEKV